MPKIHQLTARKDYPDHGIKKGDTYFKWSLKTGPTSGCTYKSKSYPKPSQLTTSSFWQTFYGISEGAETVPDDDLDGARDEIISELESLRDETQNSFDAMPENFQQGETGQKLENRISELDSLIGDLQGVVFEEDGHKETMWEEVTEHLNNFSAE